MHSFFCVELTSPQTSPVFYCTDAAGTIFGTTDVYELGFSYLSISILIALNIIKDLSALRKVNKVSFIEYLVYIVAL